jgi:hypothetical protein
MTGWELTAAGGPGGEERGDRGERGGLGEITVPVREFGGVQAGLF